ncbi:MAG: TolC family protein [Acidobacteria bacterium]|nr:TolC family protein [Acidobacteriota bacterium]
MEARHAVVWAMGVLGLLTVGLASGQEVSVPDLPQDPTLGPEAPGAVELGEEIVGPTPGAPTVSLAQAVALALEGNFALLGGADSVTSARLRESNARAQFHPRLTPRYLRSTEDDQTLGLDASQRLPFTGGSLSFTSNFRSMPDGGGPASRSADLRLTLTQPLLRGFGPTVTHLGLTESRRGRENQERTFELARQALAVEVAERFYDVVRQRQLLSVSRQSHERGQDLKEASEARVQVGLASKLDVLRAEIQASQARDAAVSAEANLETALENFRVLLGLAPTEPVEPEAVELPGPDEVAAGIDPLEILVERALANRLDLRETRDQVADARRNLSVARQNLLPQLDLNVGVTQFGSGPTFSDSLKADRRVNVFFSTSYPLERSQDRMAKALAEIDLRARERTLTQRTYAVEAEVRAALRNMDRIRKSIDLQRKSVEFAGQQHRLATLRYQRGLASNFDVVDAEGSLVAARTALIGLLNDYQVTRIRLLRVTGTLDVGREFTP